MSDEQTQVQPNQRVSTAPYFDRRAPNWSSHYRNDPRFARRYDKIRSLLERIVFSKSKSGSALDVGCGSGVFTELIAGFGWEVAGIDQSGEMIAQARSSAEKLTGVRLKPAYSQGSLESLRNSQERYDLVVAFSILEYVSNDREALEILSSIVRTGGVLVLSVPNRRGFVRKLERTLLGLNKLFGGRLMKGRGEYLDFQRHQYVARELDQLLSALGMRRIEGEYVNAAIAFPKWVLPLFERVWWAAMYLAVYEKL